MTIGYTLYWLSYEHRCCYTRVNTAEKMSLVT